MRPGGHHQVYNLLAELLRNQERTSSALCANGWDDADSFAADASSQVGINAPTPMSATADLKAFENFAYVVAHMSMWRGGAHQIFKRFATLPKGRGSDPQGAAAQGYTALNRSRKGGSGRSPFTIAAARKYSRSELWSLFLQ